jgi:MarR family protein
MNHSRVLYSGGMSDRDDNGGSWTLLTGHGHVLVEITRSPDARIRDISAAVGLTERTVQAIVADLEAAGYLTRTRAGRRTRYIVNHDSLFRQPPPRAGSGSARSSPCSPPTARTPAPRRNHRTAETDCRQARGRRECRRPPRPVPWEAGTSTGIARFLPARRPDTPGLPVRDRYCPVASPARSAYSSWKPARTPTPVYSSWTPITARDIVRNGRMGPARGQTPRPGDAHVPLRGSGADPPDFARYAFLDNDC